MAKLYVGCSLTQAPDRFVNQVGSLKAMLRQQGHEVADFVGVVNGTPVDVYETDIHRCVAECDLMVAVCDFPSIGLGWEIATMVEKHRRPVLAVAHHEAKVSRLLLGADCDRNPHYRFTQYMTMEAIPGLVSLFLRELRITTR